MTYEEYWFLLEEEYIKITTNKYNQPNNVSQIVSTYISKNFTK